MNWNPPTKQINDPNPIQVRQELERGGGELSCPNPLLFTWDDLMLSLARTMSLLSAVPELSHCERQELAQANGAFLASHMNVFVDHQNDEFLFTTKVNVLADEQRTSLAAKVGAAVADLVMHHMGFHWSANARELDLKLKGGEGNKKIPDFVYDPGGGHGFEPQSVVVVEAKGSLSKQKAKRRPILNLAQEAYNEQVRHVIGAESGKLVVASGCAIAFGTVPGEHLSTLAVASPQPVRVGASSGVRVHSLSAAASHAQQPAPQPTPQIEHMHTYPVPPWRRGGGGGPPDGGYRRERERRTPSGRIAYANYESVFLLCGAANAARVIRNALSGERIDTLEPDNLMQEVWIVEHRGRRFWMAHDRPFWLCPAYPLFAIYEPSAKEILRSVADNPDGVPETISLGIAPIADHTEFDRDGDIAIQGDGLALFRFPPPPGEHREWNLREGEWR